jgi:transketolase
VIVSASIISHIEVTDYDSSVTNAPRLDSSLDTAAIAIIRSLAMDAPLAAKSGHQGTAMALAPLAHVLYSRVMKHHPVDAQWPDRDRFILSIGHASILQYAMLYLVGYGLEMNDLKAFRQWDSLTPGHPEVGHTVGVEVTTGPLGQGFANAVGMAIAEEHLRARFGVDNQDHHTWVIAGDGCLMEGVSHEAASLAGHLKLERLICIFDDNKITIDGSTSLTCSDDVPARFRSYGWNVIEAGEIAEDCDALEAVLLQAKNHTGSPTLVVLRSHVGFPSPDFTDKHEAHGNPFTAEHVSATKKVMGIPDEPFWAPTDVVDAYRSFCATRCVEAYTKWSQQSSDKRSTFAAIWNTPPSARDLPEFGSDSQLATRVAFQQVLDATLPSLPQVVSGSADLTGNTGVKLSGQNGFSASSRDGRQVYYGIREHAMGAALVGMALHGGVIPVGGTFFVFADYMRPAIRLAALSSARCVFVFSHDSVGVGEDGPTHQPVEHLATLRAIPGLQVIRPADQNETAQAWSAALQYNGPTALILSRQNVPAITDGSAVATGAAVIKTVDSPHVVLVATGSEVSVAVAAADALLSESVRAQVVSMPSWDRFATQSASFQHSVFPNGVPVVSIEAATTFGWDRYADAMVGIDRFGASAPGNVVMEQLGINVANVVATVKKVMSPK